VASRAGRRRVGLGLRHRRRSGWRSAKARTGSLAPARQGRPAVSGRLAAYVATLIGWVEPAGDITMPKLAARQMAQKPVSAHPASLLRLLRLHGFTVKKNCWRAKPITPMSSVRGRCGSITVSYG